MLFRAHAAAYPGPRGWIGVNDAVVLVDILHGAEMEVLTIYNGQEVESLLPKLVDHFDIGGGPVMVGGGADPYSKTVVGVALNMPGLLIFDPHFDGPVLHVADESQLQELWNRKWIAWKTLQSCFPSSSFYNIGLLRRNCSSKRTAQRRESAALPPSTNQTAADSEWSSLIEVIGEGREGSCS